MGADYRITQKVGAASLTYIPNMANRLAKAYDQANPAITISSVAIAQQPSPAVASAAAVAPINGVAGMGFTFHLVTAACTPASADLTMIVNCTLSNGDVDPIEIAVAPVA